MVMTTVNNKGSAKKGCDLTPPFGYVEPLKVV